MTEERMITAKETDTLDRALRPKLLRDYIGQAVVREQISIFIEAARGRQDALDHVLIFGPPGLAKPRSRILWQMKWVSVCGKPQDPF